MNQQTSVVLAIVSTADVWSLGHRQDESIWKVFCYGFHLQYHHIASKLFIYKLLISLGSLLHKLFTKLHHQLDVCSWFKFSTIHVVLIETLFVVVCCKWPYLLERQKHREAHREGCCNRENQLSTGSLLKQPQGLKLGQVELRSQELYLELCLGLQHQWWAQVPGISAAFQSTLVNS